MVCFMTSNGQELEFLPFHKREKIEIKEAVTSGTLNTSSLPTVALMWSTGFLMVGG